MIKRIDHIAIVVDDIDLALDFWRDTLGLDLAHVEAVAEQQSAVAFLPTGDSEVELVKPTSDTSGVARFLAKRGPGLHHICFEVDDIDATLAALKARGARLIDEQPHIGTGGKKIAFVHPEATHGVLVELYELTPTEPEQRLANQLGLADRVMQEGQVMGAAVLGFLNRLVTGQNGGQDDKRPGNHSNSNKP